jgi:hypothetical protein
MALFNHYNVSSIHEFDMETEIIEFLENQEYLHTNGKPINIKVYRQIHDLRISRISDIVMIKGAQLINIECKLNDVGGVIKQAKDHLAYANYSYIAMPTKSYIAPYHQAEMIKLGIGLLLWDLKNKILVEVIYAKYNRLDKFGKMHKKEKLKTLKKVDLKIKEIETLKQQKKIQFNDSN